MNNTLLHENFKVNNGKKDYIISGLKKTIPPCPIIRSTVKGYAKATSVLCISMSLTILLSISLVDYCKRNFPDSSPDSLNEVPVTWFILLYFSLLLLSRAYSHGPYILYEILWGCNVSLVLAAIGFYTSRPLLVGISISIVSGDQLCWYIDVIAWIITGKTPIGVIKYLSYPENRSFSKTFFASHHLWFLPLCLYHLLESHKLSLLSFPMSMVITGFLASCCRLMTPFHIYVQNNKKEKSQIYLNINGAYAFWKDIPISQLHLLDFTSPIFYLPYLCIVGNIVVNGVPFILLYSLSHLF